ncbi:uncharacterized protein LOC119391545 [Rhipicephalus sanguineus]|uniref:uncharacterized protein LOC119391545 n=1 Tax=Rhipicephalus sanguineus TaxID=34632 RepID=UPI0018938FA7|nr:uncharacterized protein LOC119391545 [Rhipicephalus sanguineus]
MDTPQAPPFSFCNKVSLLCALVMGLCMSGLSTYALWYYTMSDPLLNGCCELSDDQFRMLRGNYFNMTLLKLNRTWFLENMRDCAIVINATQQLAPQRCCSERHLLSLTMPSDAFKRLCSKIMDLCHIRCR